MSSLLSSYLNSFKPARVVGQEDAIARIRESLQAQGKILCETDETSRLRARVGRFYVTDAEGFVVEVGCSIRALAEQLRILDQREVLAEDVA